jgi:hypothetical protein
MSEYLTFNKSGQWDLHKATSPNDATDREPKSDYKPGSKEFKVFRGAALNGDLHADHGQKGTLHDSGHGVRPKQINWGNVGKPSRNAASVHNERNPGVGD